MNTWSDPQGIITFAAVLVLVICVIRVGSMTGRFHAWGRLALSPSLSSHAYLMNGTIDVAASHAPILGSKSINR